MDYKAMYEKLKEDIRKNSNGDICALCTFRAPDSDFCECDCPDCERDCVCRDCFDGKKWQWRGDAEALRNRTDEEDGCAFESIRFIPCKIGDEAYVIRNCKGVMHAMPGKISELYFSNDMALSCTVKNVGRGKIGKKVFLSKDAAESEISRGAVCTE